MKRFVGYLFILLFTILDISVTEPLEPVFKADSKNEKLKVICYFTHWAGFRDEQGKFLPENIDPNLCTHIIYGYAGLHPEKLTIERSINFGDGVDNFYDRIATYRQKNIKVMIAIGGLSDSVGLKYDRLLTDTNEHTTYIFVESVMQFMKFNKLDGLELEYPSCWLRTCRLKSVLARKGFLRLVKALSEAFKPKRWLLSTTVSANPLTLDDHKDISQFSQYFDWISLITHEYDKAFGGPVGDITQWNAFDKYDLETSVKLWLQRGCPREKLILGISSAGQSLTLTKSKSNGRQEVNIGKAGPFSNIPGTLAYYEICNNTQNNGWTIVRDPKNEVGSQAYHDDQRIFFDDVENVRAKARYIHKMDLGGAMLWTLDFDDFHGNCGCGKYPLLTALNQMLRGIGGKPIQNCT